MGKHQRAHVLPLLPGLRWKGKLTVEAPNLGKRGKPDGWLVQWDAEETSPEIQARFIYDRAILTAKQIKDWTGVDVEAKDA